MTSVDVSLLATHETFDEIGYLNANPDVRVLVESGGLPSGHSHFLQHGHREGRKLRFPERIPPLMAEKLRRIEPFLRHDMAVQRRGPKFDFLSSELAEQAGLSSTDQVSENSYDPYALEIVAKHDGGLVLDCGAGRRDRYFSNVVNYEIVDYDTTDVLGIGEALPFVDATFDAVISIAVLEHVKNPFKCAAEIARVLKPGGDLICAVPFLQPFHGYPHHYFNMSHMGLRTLFEGEFDISRQFVAQSLLPIWSLHWFVLEWANGLPPAVRQKFLSLSLQDLLAPPHTMLGQDFVTQLPEEKNFALASATYLFGQKRSA